MSERAQLADILAMLAAGAIGIWLVSLKWGVALWALLPWLAVGIGVVYRYRPQWFGWARELLEKAHRFARKFAMGISSIIPNRKPAPAIRKSRIVARETRNPGQRATLHFADVGRRKQFWTGVIAFARAFANFPILWVFAAVLFGLVWGELKYHAGRRAGQQELRTMQAEAVIRGTQAQQRHDSQAKEREVEHEETSARIRSTVQQTQEEITNADDLEAIQRAYLAGVERMRNDARAARAAAVADYVASLAN